MEKPLRETIIADVEGRDLPSDWMIRAGIAPGQRVDIVIRPPRDVLRDELRKLARRAAKSAREKGLTGPKLQRLLKEAKAAHRS